MATIKPGRYTVAEIFATCGFNLTEKASADYSPDGVDRRRVRIGGLPFDDVDKMIEIPPTAENVEITVDGEVDCTLSIEHDETTLAARADSFATALEADDPHKA